VPVSDFLLQLLRSTLPAKRETFGEYSQSIASTYKLLGSVHMSQGNMEKALKSMNKVRIIDLYYVLPHHIPLLLLTTSMSYTSL